MSLCLTRKAVDRLPKSRSSLSQTFADQAVIAIENVRLFDEVQTRTDELTQSLSSRPRTAMCSRRSAARRSICRPCSRPSSNRRRSCVGPRQAQSIVATKGWRSSIARDLRHDHGLNLCELCRAPCRLSSTRRSRGRLCLKANHSYPRRASRSGIQLVDAQRIGRFPYHCSAFRCCARVSPSA